ncbi:peptide deformylase [Candidatus Aerophobetes bacterium]|nr:peptide deformylase [Candidatus Aerophobetes bacterium]
MPVYEIRKYGDPILRRKSQRLERIGPQEQKIFSIMAETMYKARGIGLAAPQIGIERQMIVVDIGNRLIKLANPLILAKEGESFLEEGCLSVPQVTVGIKRAKKVWVKGWDEREKEIEMEAEDLLARVILHEVDHLQGILIVDYFSPRDKENFKKELRKR